MFITIGVLCIYINNMYVFSFATKGVWVLEQVARHAASAAFEGQTASPYGGSCRPIGILKRIAPLPVVEPCVGIGAWRALCNMADGQYVPAFSCDSDAELKHFYECYGLGDSVRCGAKGDMFAADIHNVQAALLICGAPCQPFAPNGNQLGLLDERSEVLEKALEWIVELAWKGELIAFALENSAAIVTMQANPDSAILEYVIRRLEVQISFFAIEPIVHNLHDLIPHHRTRLWIRGLRRDSMCTRKLPPPLDHTDFPHKSLVDFLDLSMPAVDLQSLSQKKKSNFAGYCARIAADRDRGKAGSIACFDLSRGCDKQRTAPLYYDKILALRCKGTDVFMVSVNTACRIECEGLQLCRYLSMAERFALQGHDGNSAALFRTKGAAMRACGNAFAVEQMAAMVVPLLEHAYCAGTLTKDGYRRLARDEIQTLIDMKLSVSG